MASLTGLRQCMSTHALTFTKHILNYRNALLHGIRQKWLKRLQRVQNVLSKIFNISRNIMAHKMFVIGLLRIEKTTNYVCGHFKYNTLRLTCILVTTMFIISITLAIRWTELLHNYLYTLTYHFGLWLIDWYILLTFEVNKTYMLLSIKKSIVYIQIYNNYPWQVKILRCFD